MFRASAPGKLFISGEWSILERGSLGIVAAVDRRVFAEAGNSPGIAVRLRDFGISAAGEWNSGIKWLECSGQQEKTLSFAKAAIETALAYVGKEGGLRISSWEDSSGGLVGGKKVGFGSSAASVVAIVSAILGFSGFGIKGQEAKKRLYKLSAIAHYLAQGKAGSGFDVAASVFGGVFAYSRFDPGWLEEQLNQGRMVKDIADSEWPGLIIEPLEIPEGFCLLVGWTGKPASTTSMLAGMEKWKARNPEAYCDVLGRISETSSETVSEWKSGNFESVLGLLRKNRSLLAELGEKSGVGIETPALEALGRVADEMGCAGKLSGAGGGDCGIAVCFDNGKAEEIKRLWRDNNIVPLEVSLSAEGVKEES